MHLLTFRTASCPPLHIQWSRQRVEVLALLRGCGDVHFEMMRVTALDRVGSRKLSGG
jgi:hypothetical protein